ncbi:MAG: hypothetical protein ACK4WC_07105, partial [Rubrimonas sp.]
MAPTSNRRIERGAGVSRVPRVPYDVDLALDVLKRFRGAVLIGAQAPVGFFAYPGRPSTLLPAGCQIVELAHRGADAAGAVRMLADELDARPLVPADAARPLEPAAGPITHQALGAAFAAGSQEDGGGAEELPFNEGDRGGNPEVRAVADVV